VLGRPKRGKSARAFLWEDSYRRLRVARLLGRRGVIPTCCAVCCFSSCSDCAATCAACAELGSTNRLMDDDDDYDATRNSTTTTTQHDH
jgi:hypothetical protein